MPSYSAALDCIAGNVGIKKTALPAVASAGSAAIAATLVLILAAASSRPPGTTPVPTVVVAPVAVSVVAPFIPTAVSGPAPNEVAPSPNADCDRLERQKLNATNVLKNGFTQSPGMCLRSTELIGSGSR
ncbi:hypothetical protein D3C87_1357850 [compost metagenome]